MLVVVPDTLGAVDHSGAVRAPTEFACGLSGRLAPHESGDRLAQRGQVTVAPRQRPAVGIWLSATACSAPVAAEPAPQQRTSLLDHLVGKRELRGTYVRFRQPRTFGRKRLSAWLLSEVRGVGMIQSGPPSGAELLRPVRPSFSRELPEAIRQRVHH